MNEPEWIIYDLPQGVYTTLNTMLTSSFICTLSLLTILLCPPPEQSVNGQANPVSTANFYRFASQISSAVHANTNHYVTLGTQTTILCCTPCMVLVFGG